MTRICIDTNAYSAFKKGDTRVKQIIEEADEVLIPVTVLGELYAGFYMGKKFEQNIEDLEKFLASTGIEIIKNEKAVAQHYGKLVQLLHKNGTPIPTNDIWIAAVVLETNSHLLTFDKHFNNIPGLQLI